jgi:hypothetical protein
MNLEFRFPAVSDNLHSCIWDISGRLKGRQCLECVNAENFDCKESEILILICFWIDPLHMTGFRWKITPCKTSWAWSCRKYFCIVDRNGGNRSFSFDRVSRCSSEKIGGGDEFSLEIIFIILVCNFSGILQMKMSQIRFYDLCDCN